MTHSPDAQWTARSTAGAARRGLLIACFFVICFARSASAQVNLPEPKLEDAITVAADQANHWTQGVYEVWWLRGNVLINQGLTYARASEGMIWVERGGAKGDPPHKLIAYLEGSVSVDFQEGEDGIVKGEQPVKARVTDKTWLGRFQTSMPLKLHFPEAGGEPNPKPPIFDHGMQAREPKFRAPPVRTAQFAEPNAGISQPRQAPPVGPAAGGVLPPMTGPPNPVPNGEIPPVGARRLRAFPRSDARVQLQWFPSSTGNEWVAVVSSGVNLVVDGLQNFGSVDVAADRLVIWTSNSEEPLLGGQGLLQSENTPLEIYMEGNIVFRQGDRVIYANRMYYDVRRQLGIVIEAELLTPVPNYDGALRLRARVLEQLGPNNFVGQDGSLTSSRLGVPSYDLRTGQVTYQDIQQPAINPLTGQAIINPQTGEPVIEHRRQATALGNGLYVGDVPVFYWPYLATDLEAPNYYINGVQLRNDRIFGTQVMLDFDAYQLLGIKNKPEGTTWDLSTDYLSRRGPAAGTSFSFDRPGLFGIPGRAYGVFDAWGIYDTGHDNLGLNRRNLVPERGPWRGRILARDRWLLPNDFKVTGEFGIIKDYNFLEQYFEQEWDQFKDQTTDLEIKQQRDYWSWAVYGQARLNDFFTETQWLPRLDHFALGKSLLDDRLTWFEHSSAGYAQQRISQLPTNAADLATFGYLPWESHTAPQVPGFSPSGDRLATRQEIDLPLNVGPGKIVPYALGELAHWGQVLDGGDLSRAYGQVGIRASIPFWSTNPNIQSQLMNLNGLAHKVTFDTNVFASQSTQNLNQLPLYDLIDDQAIIRYRRIFPFYDFGGPAPVPLRYDERYWALRSGLGGDVTGPTEIAGNMLEAQLGVRQRWQTKRGLPGNERVVDWMQFDMQGTVFPDAQRDNFGTAVGMVNYNYRWFIGDRTTVVSDGYFDFFGGAPKYVSLGTFLNRPPRGSFYAGVLLLEGPISSTVLITSYNYRMSPKWVSTMGSTFALNKSGNIGQNFSLTRIGEAFLFSVGVNVDASKGNVGANISLEPRFLSRAIAGAANGVQIPAAGAFGLE